MSRLGSLNHFRYFVITGARGDRVGERILVRQRLMGDVFAEGSGFIGVKKNLRHRLDACGVKRFELFNMRQNVPEILRHAEHFLVG